MKKWYNEEYEFEIEFIVFLRGDKTEGYCRNCEEIGGKYKCAYGCPVNSEGQGIYSKVMMIMFPNHGSCEKWRIFREYRRRRKI